MVVMCNCGAGMWLCGVDQSGVELSGATRRLLGWLVGGSL